MNIEDAGQSAPVEPIVMPSFADWIAIDVSEDHDEPEETVWAVSPRKFWDRESAIPDSHIGRCVPFFTEIQEHTIQVADGVAARNQLECLGFEVLDSPQWWYAGIEA